MSTGPKRNLAAALAFAAIGYGLYANTLASPFFFDDTPSIEENPYIEALWPPSRALGAPPGAGSSGRPLVSLSLALNYALGEREVLGYHLFNIATLVLGALTLFGLARRLLERSVFAAGGGLAFALALVWMVHPLHTDTLNHVVYRNGSMMALFYLLALYASVRGHEEGASPRWSLACVIAAAAAMACKEVAVSLPLVVLAFDRQFGARSLRSALARRPAMYTGLAATWGLLALCVLSGDRGDSVGYGHTEIIGAVDYLRTQMVAITRYLRLSALADDFVFDYFGQGVVRSWSAVAVETVVLGLWLAASLLGLFKRSTLGLLSLCFFALLAPTSSVIPLAGELIGEHRMYLPLVPLVAIAALVMYRWIEPLVTWRPWLGPLFVLLAASPAAWRTVERNADYRTRVTLWQDTVEKRPENSRAWSHLATALKNEGRLQEAEPAYLRALELDPRDGKTSYNYGNVLFERGDLAGALERYRVAALHDGDDPNIRFNLGYALVASGDLRAGLAEYRAALELRPGWERPQMLLAWTLATAPDASVRDGREALRLARALNEASGNRLPRHLDTLAAALAETGEFELAQDAARRAVAGARAAGNVAAAREIEQRLHLYEARLPFRSG